MFVNQNTDPHVAKADLEGLVNDFGAGITSKYSLINARPAQGSLLDVGVKQIHQGAWNGVAGLNDIYSRDIYFLVVDSGTFRHPYTGEIVPIRSEWVNIETEGPDGRLGVSDEALAWDPASQEWVHTSGESISAVTFDLMFSNWHHGQPMTAADFMLLYSARYGSTQPALQVDVVRPDGNEFRVYFASLPPARGDQNIFPSSVLYRQSHRRISAEMLEHFHTRRIRRGRML